MMSGSLIKNKTLLPGAKPFVWLLLFLMVKTDSMAQVNSFQWWNMSPILYNPAYSGFSPTREFIRKVRTEVGFQTSQGSLVRYPYLAIDNPSRSGISYGLSFSSERMNGRMLKLDQLSLNGAYKFWIEKEARMSIGMGISALNKLSRNNLIAPYIGQENENEILLNSYFDTSSHLTGTNSQTSLLYSLGTVLGYKKNELGIALNNLSPGPFRYPSRLNINFNTDLKKLLDKEVHFRLYYSRVFRQNVWQGGFLHEKKRWVYSLFLHSEKGSARNIFSIDPGVSYRVLFFKATYSTSVVLNGRGFLQHHLALRFNIPNGRLNICFPGARVYEEY